MPTPAEILNILSKVYDPEIPLSVTELGIVKEEDISISDGNIRVLFTPTSPICPMGGVIGILIKYELEKVLGREVEVKVKPGTHIQESSLNRLLDNREEYERQVSRLKSLGLIK